MNEHLRQTGRTTRMLSNAASYCAQGRAVYVYAHSREYAQRLQDQLGPKFPSVKIEVLPEGFNWETMRPYDRMHSSCVVLVDHATVEVRLAELDREILRRQQLARQLYHLTT